MAMERLRAQIMQQDQVGMYRVLGGNPPINHSQPNVTKNLSPGSNEMPRSMFETSEVSARDHFGHPDSCAIGHIFATRQACCDAKVHRATMQGIVGTVGEGAFSVVVSGGYEDDIDEGDVIWYTGAGGQSNRWGGSEAQTSHQSFDHPDNRKLWRNTETRHPVRVIRGSKCSKWGPLRGYRYDGLYDVIDADYVKGKSGYMICRFKLQRRPGQTPLQNLPRA